MSNATMEPDAILEAITRARLLAVVRAPSPEGAVKAAEAVAAGGVSVVEIAFTTPDAASAIAELTESRPDLVVGAGTVVDVQQARAASAAGAAFFVSPHYDPSIIEWGRALGVLTVPGVLTPSEVALARQVVPVIKLFPGSLGGPGYLRALRGPFPDLRAIPTGGVTAGNAAEWLEAGAVAVGAAGDLCSESLIAAGGFDEITKRARGYADAVGAAPARVGGAS